MEIPEIPPLVFEGQRISNKPSEEDDEWYLFGDHRHTPDLIVLREAEQVAILWEAQRNVIHFCVAYAGNSEPGMFWRSCKYMTAREFFELYDDNLTAQLELAQSELNFLKSMYT